MKKLLSVLMIVVMVFALAACGETDPNEKSEGVLKYEEYVAAALNEEVTIEAFVQDHQSWWDDKITVYAQDGTGGYFFVGGEMKFTYTDDGTALTIQYETATEPNVFKYTIEGDTLKIEDSLGDMITYIKK